MDAIYTEPTDYDISGSIDADNIAIRYAVTFGPDEEISDWLTVLGGGLGNDTLAIDIGMFGGSSYRLDHYTIVGGDGSDAMSLTLAGNLAAYGLMNGGTGNNDLIARINVETEANLEARAGDGDDTMDLIAEAADFGSYIDAYGFGGNDYIRARAVGGTEGLSRLYGGEGDDTLIVSGSGGMLYGNQGSDTLIGSGYDDRLVGGDGIDYLTGRAGADEFAFLGMRAGAQDRITDFAIGEDVIDISRIDASVFRGGSNVWTFAGADDWHGTGRVWVQDLNGFGDPSVVYLDNGETEMRLIVWDGAGVDASDYSAGDFLL